MAHDSWHDARLTVAASKIRYNGNNIAGKEPALDNGPKRGQQFHKSSFSALWNRLLGILQFNFWLI